MGPEGPQVPGGRDGQPDAPPGVQGTVEAGGLRQRTQRTKATKRTEALILLVALVLWVPSSHALPLRLDRPHRRPAPGPVRGGHLPGQRPRRPEAEQDQLGGPPQAPAERSDRHRRGEPVPAREQGQGAPPPPPGPVPGTPRTRPARIPFAPPRLRRGPRAGRETAPVRQGPAALADGWVRAGYPGRRRSPGRGGGRTARAHHRQPRRLPPNRPETLAGGQPIARPVRSEAATIVSGAW